MPRLWVDLTTSYQDAGLTAHGTLRVERALVGALADESDPRIGFVVYDAASCGFLGLSIADVRRILAMPTRRDLGRELVPLWRRRIWGMRARLGRLLPRPSGTGSSDPVAFAAGETLLFLGEHSRQDFAHLAALKSTRHMALVFLFYDLLRVLDDNDPLLHAGPWNALPQTDFMVREATLFLSISRFSADILRNHIVRRGANDRPIVPIRLSGQPPMTSVSETPVPGLDRNHFVLSIGDVVCRKNHKLLVQVWRTLIGRGVSVPILVIAGRIDPEGNELVRSVRRDPRLRDVIRFLPNVDDASLRWMYRNCRYTAFPSFLEGFGLPVAESLSFGKPCLASSASAIPEAGQGAAITLDPNDAAAWEAEVVRLNDDAILAAETTRVPRSFRSVTWSDTAREIVAVLIDHGLLDAASAP